MNFRAFNNKTKIREFSSIGEMVSFLSNTEDNGEYFEKSSQDRDREFTLTSSYEEAMNLLLSGWSEVSKMITRKLSTNPAMETTIRQRSVYSMAGHTASVPRYLQGIPTNMISSVPEKRKQPIVTINHSIAYSAFWQAESILREGIKALQIVQAIEAGNKRVKLNIVCIAEDCGHKRGFKVTIKQPGERLNVSKMAFPLAHPSMLRRMFFKYMEVEPDMPHRFNCYGRPCNELCKEIYPNEFYIPERIPSVEEFLTNLK